MAVPQEDADQSDRTVSASVAENRERLFSEYRAMAQAENRVLFGGRLGEYAYYDMDAVILSALEAADRELQICV